MSNDATRKKRRDGHAAEKTVRLADVANKTVHASESTDQAVLSAHAVDKTVPVGHESHGWWREHGIDVFVALLTMVGLWIGWQIPVSLNVRDSAERQKAEANAKFDSDISRVNELLAGVLGEESNEHARAKQAVARALAEYAQQGLIYAPATTALFRYLEKETDPKTHCYLLQAISGGLTQMQVKLNGNQRPVQLVGENPTNAQALLNIDSARLQADKKAMDVSNCSSITDTAPSPALVLPKVTQFSQYLDVDCERKNVERDLHIPLDSALTSKYKIASATAQIQNPSNLQTAHADVSAIQADGVNVNYEIVGLDRQLFGNCPGGGHGTLVVTFNLEPK